ncbi:MAG TPA: RHS repeat-associated core domain-containing protein [Flavobacterium sp.]|jgi:RHS repeat-associated protein
MLFSRSTPDGESLRSVTLYAGAYQYELISERYQNYNFTLKFFSQPEGYVAYNNGIFSYIYQYKDHLGNNRLSYSDSNNDGQVTASEIIEEDNYYPFGLKHKEYNSIINGVAHKYKYQGKEWQDELGLNVYSYGWRDYDPAIGRFTKIDRFAEKYYKLTPYGYAGNNPVFINDIQGDSLWINHRGNRYLYEYDKSNGGQLYTVANGTKTAYTGRVNGFLDKAFNSLNSLNQNSKTAGGILGNIQASNFNVSISHSSNNPDGNKNQFISANNANSYAFARYLANQGTLQITEIGSGGTVYWNPNNGAVWELNKVNQQTNTTTNLFHELTHSWDSINGESNNAPLNSLSSNE